MDDTIEKPVLQTDQDFIPICEGPNKFHTFLEDNLSSVINCPISGLTCFSPVLCDDGFYYEESVVKEYLNRFNAPNSPITRQPITKKCYNSDLIQQLITFSDKHNLEVGKDKFINNDSFEENSEIIQNYVMNNNFDKVYKFKSFTLAFGDTNEKMFCRKILNNDNNTNEYVNCIKYILDNSTDITFVNTSLNNILHIFFAYCKVPVLFDYVFTKIPDNELQNMLQFKNNRNSTPIDMALNYMPAFSYIIEKNIYVDINLKTLNSCILKNMDNETLFKLVSRVENINVFDNDNNMSPMFCAIHTSNIDLINYLISCNYDMNIKSPNDMNAFHYVAKDRESTVFEYIINMCENLEETSADGWSILHLCSYCNGYNAIMFLLEKFVNVTTPIIKFRGEDKNYLPMNLVEINQNLSDDERESIISYMCQLTELQLY